MKTQDVRKDVSGIRHLTTGEVEAVMGGYRDVIETGSVYMYTNHTIYPGSWCVETYSTWVSYYERDDVTHELVYELPQAEFGERHEYLSPDICHGSTKA